MATDKDPGAAPRRRRRADGIESRQRILEAAIEVAGERGYEGTSIGAVSALCGLPASSIYWHFKDKDDLIAAVIRSSFETWLAAIDVPDAGTNLRDRLAALAAGVAKSLLEAPDFLRLGLMLSLERRPEEATGRAVFREIRETAVRWMTEMVGDLVPAMPGPQVRLLAAYSLAAADGLFFAHELDDDGVDLVELFRLHADVMATLAIRLVEEGEAGR